MSRLPDPAGRLLSTLWPSLLIAYLCWAVASPVLPEAVLRAVAGVQTAATPTVLILIVLILAVLMAVAVAVAVAHDTGTRERVRGERR